MESAPATTHIVQDNTLVYTRNGCEEHIELDTPAWQHWLAQATSFTFRSSEGNFTAHKTRASNGRGGWYWYAYRRQQGQLGNLYLGTSTRLTSQRLHEAARTLALARNENTTNPAGTRSLSTTSPETTLALARNEGTTGLTDTRAFSTLSPETMPDAFTPPFSVSREEPEQSHRESNRVARPDLLLTARLYIPRLSAQHVARPHLLALLDRGTRGAMTLISASAGSGKTSLLAEWATRTQMPLAWLSLESSDNDPARFLTYLVTALARLDTRIEPTYQAADAQNPASALTGIINALTDLLEREAVLILDDYHVVTSETIHALVSFLLTHLPPRLHLIVSTRIDPPWPLARFRARNQLCEVRAQELCFARDEVRALTDSMGLTLSSEAAQILEQRTEGWIAGIQLLALALHGQTDTLAFLRRFRGTHRFFLAYVSEEILAQQAPDTRRFLLYTSILTRMTGPLCEAVTGLPDGQGQLAELLRANLFVSTLDDAETWYRYHALFAEALLARLQKL